ncbi:photosynthetic reaction center subunit H [Hyphomonas sp.]|uniref:photosynthetic reaction center subunit H n=1 Tax=Hyphomonas sp. TaxID=87 RepID=UPI0039197B3C
MLFSGEFVNGVDLVDVCLWAFTIFFVILIYYLLREGAREGYPLEEDTTGRSEGEGIFFFPPKKTFNLPNGRGTIDMSYGPADTRQHALKRTAPWPGAPMEPDGDPMTAGVGPGSYAERLDEPDLNWDGSVRIEPYRLNPDYTVSKKDLDPRGLPVVGVDGVSAGKVVDLWVDKAEAIIRYFEVELTGSGARVLLPVPFATLSKSKKQVDVWAVKAAHFANVPRTKSPDQVTRLEEDKISGYYGAGTLYATPERVEPLL